MAGGQRLDAKSLQGTGDSDGGKGFDPARLYIADHDARGFVRFGGVGRSSGACFAYGLDGDGTANLLAPRLGCCRQGRFGALAGCCEP
jgi:hypothetical protein